MRKLHIKEKLSEIGVSISDVCLGDYDYIGRFTAEKQRAKEDPLYRSVGCFFKPNLERGVLMSSLIKQYGLSSFLEIGFGRGYTTFCVAKTFHDLGIDGKIVTIDPELSQEKLNVYQQVFPQEWFKHITFMQGLSSGAIPTLTETFDIVYVDGDHSYQGTKNDWDLIKNKIKHVCVFDDYHLPSKNDPGIQCRLAIDEIDWKKEGYLEPELVIGDRRLFVDDRGYSDDMIDYGQAVFTKVSTKLSGDW